MQLCSKAIFLNESKSKQGTRKSLYDLEIKHLKIFFCLFREFQNNKVFFFLSGIYCKLELNENKLKQLFALKKNVVQKLCSISLRAKLTLRLREIFFEF